MEKDGRIVACGTIPFDSPELEVIFKAIVHRYQPYTILVEDVPTPTQSELDMKLKVLGDLIRRQIPVYNRCRSADWKPTLIKRWYVPNVIFGYRLTQHTKDAIRMGWWFLKFRCKLEVRKIDSTRESIYVQVQGASPGESAVAPTGQGIEGTAEPTGDQA